LGRLRLAALAVVNTGAGAGVSGSMLPAPPAAIPISPAPSPPARTVPPASDPGWHRGAAVTGADRLDPDVGAIWGLFRKPYGQDGELILVALVEPNGIGGWLWTVPMTGLTAPVGGGATAMQAMELAASALGRAAVTPAAKRNDRQAAVLLERWRSGGRAPAAVRPTD
jgi:hypothetical protein